MSEKYIISQKGRVVNFKVSGISRDDVIYGRLIAITKKWFIVEYYFYEVRDYMGISKFVFSAISFML